MAIPEKRRFPRVEVDASLRYQIRGRPESNHALCDDLSLNGIGVLNDRFIAPNTPLNLEIGIWSKILNIIGKVAWSSPLPHSNNYRLGIEFLEINPQEKHYLADFIDMRRGSL